MSIDRDHFPINVTGDTEGSPMPPPNADPDLSLGYPDYTHRTLPIASPEEPEHVQPYVQDPAVQETVSAPWYKKKGVKIIGAAGVGLSVLAGAGYAVATHGGGAEKSSSSNESSFQDDIIIGKGFSELPAAEQMDIRNLHNLTFEDFAKLPIEQQYRYSEYVIDANKQTTIDYSKLRHPFTHIPALVDYGTAMPNDTAYEVETQRALKVAVASRLIDLSTGTGVPKSNYNEQLKLSSYILKPGSDSYGLYVANVKDMQRQKLDNDNITPCTVLEAQKSDTTVAYTCKMEYVEKGGYTYAKRVAEWVPFTSYNGTPSGTWVFTVNEGYKSEPHL